MQDLSSWRNSIEMRSLSVYISLSLLQLSLLLLHPLHKHLPHLILPPLQLHQELLTLGLVRLLQTVNMCSQAISRVARLNICVEIWQTCGQLTWQACTLGPCLWTPFPPVCSVCTARSGECASAPGGPPCSHRSASPSASQSRSGSRSPLTHTSTHIRQTTGGFWKSISTVKLKVSRAKK